MKIAVGISGGVDSAVAALLLKERGHEVVGVTMTLGRADEAKSLAEAEIAAARLGIELKTFDFSREWQSCVLDYVRTTYVDGKTPNPCVKCNETVKFGLLPRAAFELGCARFATGHYARLTAGGDGRVRLLRGVDHGKDQSYFLYRVDPAVLARTLLPLGEMTKAEVRAFARSRGLATADKGDSQDFCGGDPRQFIGAPPREGEIVTVDGCVIGHHRGFWNYTVGKRRGLGVGGGTPYYVVGLDAVNNRVIVAFKEKTFVREFRIGACRWLNEAAVQGGSELMLKVRSAGEPKGPVTVERTADGGARVICAVGIAGVAPGQSAVLFADEEVVGGGTIL